MSEQAPVSQVNLDDVQLHGLWRWAEASGADDPEVRYIGARARYAVMLFLGLPVQLDQLTNGAEGWSMRYQGLTVDVKVSTGLLLYATPEDFTADLAILVVPNGGQPDPYVQNKKAHAVRGVELAGWVTREQFLERHRMRDIFNNGQPRAVVEPDDLAPAVSLWVIEPDLAPA